VPTDWIEDRFSSANRGADFESEGRKTEAANGSFAARSGSGVPSDWIWETQTGFGLESCGALFFCFASPSTWALSIRQQLRHEVLQTWIFQATTP